MFFFLPSIQHASSTRSNGTVVARLLTINLINYIIAGPRRKKVSCDRLDCGTASVIFFIFLYHIIDSESGDLVFRTNAASREKRSYRLVLKFRHADGKIFRLFFWRAFCNWKVHFALPVCSDIFICTRMLPALLRQINPKNQHLANNEIFSCS